MSEPKYKIERESLPWRGMGYPREFIVSERGFQHSIILSICTPYDCDTHKLAHAAVAGWNAMEDSPRVPDASLSG